MSWYEDTRFVWNVFYYNMSSKKVVHFNIFKHSRFNRAVQELLKDFDTKEEFAKELQSELMYTFRCKSEYEVIISPFAIGQSDSNVKVDIYTQVMLNWEIFVDYVWSLRG